MEVLGRLFYQTYCAVTLQVLYSLSQVLDASRRNEFFSQTLPAMVSLALRLPTLCTQVSIYTQW